MLRLHSPTVRAGPTPYTGWARLQGGQRSVSLEYQTCTSAYLFDTLVAGKDVPGGVLVLQGVVSLQGVVVVQVVLVYLSKCKSALHF